MGKRIVKGQSSFEFVLIVGVMFIIFIAAFAAIQVKMVSLAQDKQAKLLDDVGTMILAETRLAASARGDYYYRTFDLPYLLEGFNYSMTSTAPSEMVISTDDAQYIVYFDTNISGTLQYGANSITKRGGNISFNS